MRQRMVPCRIKPVRDIRGTTACRTREQIATALIAFDIDLVAVEDLFAHDTNALVIERLPFSQPIGRTQNIQSLLGVRLFCISPVLSNKQEPPRSGNSSESLPILLSEKRLTIAQKP